MKEVLKIYLVLIGLAIIVFGGLYLWIANIDFVGKTAEQVEESRARMKAMRLEAEYRNPPLQYGIHLIDSVNAEVMADNGSHGLIVFKSYTITHDTIFLTNLSPEKMQTDKDLEPYLKYKKAVIKDSLLFMMDSTNSLLPNPMKIKINKFK